MTITDTFNYLGRELTLVLDHEESEGDGVNEEYRPESYRLLKIFLEDRDVTYLLRTHFDFIEQQYEESKLTSYFG